MSLNTFDRAKIAQKFQPANARPACRICGHASKLRQERTDPLSGFQCLKGGFFVTAYAVCDAYSSTAAPGASS